MNIYKTNDCLDVKQSSLLRSTFEEADLTGTLINKVKMSNMTLRDVDLSYSSFEKASLKGTTFKAVDFRNVSFEGCVFDRATIDGIEVVALLAAYHAARVGD